MIDGIAAAAEISGTTININDQNDTTHLAATLDNLSDNDNAPFEVTGLSAAPIEYGAGVTAVNIDGGTSAGGTAGVIFNINNIQAGTITTINSGTGDDTANVTGVGVPAGTTLFLNGGPGNNTLNYFAGSQTPSQSTVEGGVLITLPGSGSVDATGYKNVSITGVLSSSTWTSVGPGPIVVTDAPPPLGETDDPDSGDDSDSGTGFGGLGPAPLGFTNPSAGRIVGIAASTTDPNTIYVVAAGGGAWKTTNGGTTWVPLTDNQATLSMGSIAIAPSNPNVIYAGTGEGQYAVLRQLPGRGHSQVDKRRGHVDAPGPDRRHGQPAFPAATRSPRSWSTPVTQISSMQPWPTSRPEHYPAIRAYGSRRTAA